MSSLLSDEPVLEPEDPAVLVVVAPTVGQDVASDVLDEAGPSGSEAPPNSVSTTACLPSKVLEHCPTPRLRSSLVHRTIGRREW
jgi:hypothetical protein